MVRAPCCEKMGLKKGPWTPEEDQTLIAFIQRYGHGNWRALPKQAGLLRCGKSCRLRWTNYLRPDIKRGNFTKEEEEAIINLHEMLGNRWSAIAARLPGRTDNEIKNVWHTHLKKRLTRNQTTLESKMHAMETSNCHISREQELKPVIFPSHSRFENSSGYVPVSPQQSSSDVSSSGTIDSSVVTSENPNSVVKDESNDDSSEKITEINDNSWSEARSAYNSSMPEDFLALSPFGFEEPAYSYGPNVDDGMDFWFNLFLKAGELPELPEI